MDTLASLRKTQIPVPDCPTIGLDVRRVMFQTGDKEVSMIPSLLMRGVRYCAMVPRTAPVPLAPTRVTGFRTRGFAANAGVSFHLHYTYRQGASLWGLQQYSSITHTLLLASGQAL